MTRGPSVTVMTNMPSPYQAALFDRLTADGLPRLDVIYRAPTLDGRAWTPRPLAHAHRFLDASGSVEEAHAVAARADLLVVSGYSDPVFRDAMGRRLAGGRPLAFWGERPGFSGHALLGRLRRRIRLASLHRSDAAIWGIGTAAVAAWRREFGDRRRYANVPYASDLSAFREIARPLRPGRVRFLFSGQFIARKGVDLLADAFLRLVRDGAGATLALVGAGPLEGELRRRLATVGDRVQFVGFTQPAELPTLYGAADILVAPSRHDGWGLIVPEGMAAGMPVISTTATGAAVDLLDATCGFVVPPGSVDALQAAMRAAAGLSPLERQRLGHAARARAAGEHVDAGARRFVNAALRTLEDHQRIAP